MAAALGLARDYGVIVSDVWPGGPAEAAGLKIGDILVSVDGQPADNLPTVNYYFRLRDSTDPVKLVVLRGKTQQSVQHHAGRAAQRVRLGRRRPIRRRTSSRELGILGVEIDRAHGRGAPRDCAIRTASSSSRAPRARRAKCRCCRATSSAASTIEQIADARRSAQDAVRALKPGAPVTLQIQREGRLMYVSFTME